MPTVGLVEGLSVTLIHNGSEVEQLYPIVAEAGNWRRPLSVRAIKVLRKATAKDGSGYNQNFSLSDMCNLTETDLLDVRNCGTTTLFEIKDFLKKRGLRLKGTL